MIETLLQTQKNQLILQLKGMIQALEHKTEVLQEEARHYQQVFEAQKAYIDELMKSQKLQNDYQELMRKENILMMKKLNDMKQKLIERDKILRRYQDEIKKEISYKELIDSLTVFGRELELRLKLLLTSSHLRPLIQEELQSSLRPYLNALRQLESIDWSTLQDEELNTENLLSMLEELKQK